MDTFEKYQPVSLSQIAFAQPAFGQDLMDYATGKASNNILLHGAFGTGKTTIALAIANERCNGGNVELINGKSEEAKNRLGITECHALITLGLLQGHKPVFIIDEVDRVGKPKQDNIVCFLDELKNREVGGMVIFTTNYLDKVDDALKSRCSTYHIKGLTPEQALPTAKRILLAEGVSKSDEWLLQELERVVPHNSEASDWRKYGQVLDRIMRNSTKEKPPPKLTLVQ